MAAFKLDDEQATRDPRRAALQDRPAGDPEDPRRAEGEEEARPRRSRRSCVEEEALGRRQGRTGRARREVRRAPQDADGVRRGRAGVRRGGVHRPREHERRADARRLDQARRPAGVGRERRASARATRSIAVVPGSTLDHVVFFADDGTAYTMRINEVPASSGYGEPITKFFKLGDQVKIVAARRRPTRGSRRPISRRRATTRGGPYLLVGDRAAARCCGCRSPRSAPSRPRPAGATSSSTRATRSCWRRSCGDETSVILASRERARHPLPDRRGERPVGRRQGRDRHQAGRRRRVPRRRADRRPVRQAGASRRAAARRWSSGPSTTTVGRGGKGFEAVQADDVRPRGAAADRAGRLGRVEAKERRRRRGRSRCSSEGGTLMTAPRQATHGRPRSTPARPS